MSIKHTIQKTKIIYPLLNKMRRTFGRLLMRFFYARHGLDRSTVLFSSYGGRRYSDNPHAISEALHDMYPDAKITWQLTSGTSKNDVPDYVKLVQTHSLQALRAYSTANVFVDNLNRPQYMLKFPEQTYIQTWHGDRGFKKVLLDMDTNEQFPDGAQMDLAISGSDFASRVYRSAFGYKGEILECGCPRNDILLKNPPKLVAETRKNLGIAPGTRVLMYAPTFRDYSAGAKLHTPLQLGKVQALLEQTTGEKWICVARGHERNHGVDSGAQMDLSDYADISGLLLITDILISDYSSIAGDFMLLGRTAIFYQPDREAYVRERALYFDPDKSPLIVAHTEAELLDLLRFPLDGAKNCREVLDFFGTHESGKASEIVAQRIVDILKNA